MSHFKRWAFFAVVLSIISQSLIHKSGLAQSSSSTEANELGEAGISLTRLPNGATEIARRGDMNRDLDVNELSLYSNTYLVKIGEVNALGKNIDELRKMLVGPVNSEFEISYNTGQESEKKTLKRYPKSVFIQKNDDFALLREMNSLFTGWLTFNAGYNEVGKAFALKGDNFLAAPAFIASVKRPKFIMPDVSEDCTAPLPDAMDFFIRNGMYERFDQCVKSVQLLTGKLSATSSESDYAVVAKCASLIADCGQQKSAIAIYQKLDKLTPYLAMETRLRVLMGQATLLEATNPKGAVTKYNQIVSLCRQHAIAPPDVPLNGLHQAVAFFVKTKRWGLAASAQLTVVDYERKKLAGYNNFRQQNLVAALLDLSRYYELEGAGANAEIVLREAVSEINGSFDLNRQTEIERIVDLGPGLVRLMLSRSCALNNKLNAARDQADAARLLFSNAFGEASTESQQVDQLCHSLHQSSMRISNSQNNVQKTKLLKAFDRIIDSSSFEKDKRVVSAQNEAAALERKMATQAFEASKHDITKACLIIEDLENRELSAESLEPDHATRLINLISLIEKPASYAIATRLLSKLDLYLKNGPNDLSNNRVYAQVELALIGDSLAHNQSSNQAWDHLTNLLNDIRVARPYYNSNPNIPYDPTTDNIEDLYSILYVYLFNEDQTKSRAILKHIETTYPRYLSPRRALCYQLLLETIFGNIVKVEKEIGALSAPPARGTEEYSRELTALGAALLQANHGQLSLNVLDPNPATKATKELFAYRRAQVDYAMGKYRDALEELSTIAENSHAIGSLMTNCQLMKANALAKVGDTNQAILDLLKYDRRDYQQTLQTNKAISLARTMKSIPTSTVEALVDAEIKLSRVLPRKDVDDRKFLFALAKEHGVSAQKMQSLDFELSHSEIDRSAPKIAIATLLSRATSAELEHKPRHNEQWMSLAWEYFAQKRYDEGTAAMLKAIELLPAGSYANMYYPGNLRQDLRFDELLKAKQYGNAEKLLKKSIEMRKSAEWDKDAYIEKEFLTELYLAQDKFSEAAIVGAQLIATIDESLCPPPQGGNIKVSYPYEAIDKFIDKKQFATAQSLLNEIDNKIKLKLGLRNSLFIEEYQMNAKLRLAKGELKEAEKLARKALDLENWYGGSHHTGTVSNSLLASILRKEGKNKEADLAALEFPYYQQPSQGIQSIWANGGQLRSFHSPPPEIYASTAEQPLKAMLDDATARSGAGSDDTINAMRHLSTFYMQQNRYLEAEQMQLRLLKLLDDQFGKCKEPKSECFLVLAEISIAEKKMESAKEYAENVTVNRREIAFENSQPKLRLAKVFLALGNNTRAYDLAKSVEKALLSYHGLRLGNEYVKDLRDCLTIMENCGTESDRAALRERLKPFIEPPQEKHTGGI